MAAGLVSGALELYIYKNGKLFNYISKRPNTILICGINKFWQSVFGTESISTFGVGDNNNPTNISMTELRGSNITKHRIDTRKFIKNPRSCTFYFQIPPNEHINTWVKEFGLYFSDGTLFSRYTLNSNEVFYKTAGIAVTGQWSFIFTDEPGHTFPYDDVDNPDEPTDPTYSLPESYELGSTYWDLAWYGEYHDGVEWTGDKESAGWSLGSSLTASDGSRYLEAPSPTTDSIMVRAYAPTLIWTPSDGDLKVDIRNPMEYGYSRDSDLFIYFALQDSTFMDYYYFRVSLDLGNRTSAALGKYENGAVVLSDSQWDVQIPDNTWRTLTISISGNTISANWRGVTLSITDTSQHDPGGIGVRGKIPRYDQGFLIDYWRCE